MTKKFAAVFNVTSVALAVIDADGRVIEANQAFGQAVGADPAALVGRVAAEVVPADKWETTVSPLGDGDAVLSLAPARERRSRVRALVDSLIEGIVVQDAEGRVVDLNLAAERLLGLSRRDALGKVLAELSNGFDFAAPPSDGECCLLPEAGSPGGERVIPLAGADGATRWVRLSLTVLDHPEAGLATVVSMVDVSCMVGAQRRLAESERKFRAIFENTFEFIGLLAPDGTLLEANLAALSFIGLDSVRSLAGLHFADTPWWRHSPESQAALREAIRVAATGEFVRFESTHRAPDDTEVVVDFSLRPITDESGQIVYLIPEGRDITQRKRDEEALIAAKLDAEAANHAKSQFLATVSHELRTPLNAVIGFSETIQAEVFGPIGNSRYGEYVGLIHSAGEQLRNLIEDILDVARIETGNAPLAEEEFDPVPLLRSTARLVEGSAASQKVALAVEMPAVLPRVIGDSLRLRQIVLNLLSNAVKFTPEGGSARLAVRVCDEGLELVVSDTGIGISKSDLENIWRPFFQADSSLSRRYGGTGLGLAIVRHFVAAHGGAISLASTLGQGTVVRVILPVERLRVPANDVARQGGLSSSA